MGIMTHKRNCTLTRQVTPIDVLLVPTFKYNLMSVVKLVHDSKMVVTFTDQGCYLQDQGKWISHLIGKLDENLF